MNPPIMGTNQKGMNCHKPLVDLFLHIGYNIEANPLNKFQNKNIKPTIIDMYPRNINENEHHYLSGFEMVFVN